MNKKGFTMVELLAVLILLGVVAIIAIPAINSTINNSKEKAKEAQSEIILNAAQSYASEHTDLLPKKGITLFNISDLIDKNYIDSSSADDIASTEYSDMCVKVRYNTKYNQYQYQITSCDDNINEDCFEYSISGSGDDKYAIITGYTWNDPSFCPMNVTIPATLGGYDVKYIADNAFDREELVPKLTGVDFSFATELIEIGREAFKYNEIRELDLSMLNKLGLIGFRSFIGNIIEEVHFSDSITDINGSSFAYNNLTSVTLPDNLDYIGGMVFYQNNLSGELDLTNCTKLNKIGGYNSEEESTYAIGTFEENNITSVKLPNSVEYIGDGAFLENPLKTINMPTSLKRIGKYAFYNNQLESTVVFPNTLLYIGSYAFVNAFSTGAPDFTNASSLKYIYSSAFNSSFTIDHLDLSGLSSLIYIYEHAFRGSQINTIDTTGMTSLRWIMLAAFEGCNITGTLDLSDSTVLLNLGEHEGDSSYYGPFHNNNLTKVVLPNVTANEYGIYDNVFRNNNNLSDVTLGSGLKHIGVGAFYNTSVSEITFPSTLKSFNSYAFRGAKLKNVVLPAGITSIASNVFYKSSSSNKNLTTITNNTAYSYDWYKITGQGSTETCSFKKGTCGTITIN